MGKSGDDPAKTFSDADQLCFRIFGDDNPKLTQIPGAIHNTTETVGNALEETDGDVPCSSKKRKVKDASEHTKEQSLDDLHRQVFLLQKEKLKLSIKKVKLELAEKAEKSTETQQVAEAFMSSPVYYDFP